MAALAFDQREARERAAAVALEGRLRIALVPEPGVAHFRVVGVPRQAGGVTLVVVNFFDRRDTRRPPLVEPLAHEVRIVDDALGGANARHGRAVFVRVRRDAEHDLPDGAALPFGVVLGQVGLRGQKRLNIGDRRRRRPDERRPRRAAPAALARRGPRARAARGRRARARPALRRPRRHPKIVVATAATAGALESRRQRQGQAQPQTSSNHDEPPCPQTPGRPGARCRPPGHPGR